MTDGDRLLVEILAATDAVWRPLRAADWHGRTPTVLYELRSAFGRFGIPWRTAQPTAAGRKAQERQLDELVAVGLLATFGRERRTRARLTECGDRYARALVDFPNVDAGLATVLEVERLGGGRVSELLLARLSNYANEDACRDELGTVELMALPALCRGWLESGSDVFGRVWYWTTETGRTAAATPCMELSGLPPMSDEAANTYFDERAAYRADLRTCAPDVAGELGYVPLSSSTPLQSPHGC